MKNFINKNWKNILIIIGVIFLVIDLFYIIVTPATIPQDFYKYGPNIESDIFDSAIDVSDQIGDYIVSGENVNSGEQVDSEQNESNNNVSENVSGEQTNISCDNTQSNVSVSDKMFKGVVIFGVALVILLLLSALVDGSDSKK